MNPREILLTLVDVGFGSEPPIYEEVFVHGYSRAGVRTLFMCKLSFITDHMKVYLEVLRHESRI